MIFPSSHSENSHSHGSFFKRFSPDRPGGEFFGTELSELNVYANQTFITSWDVNHLTSASIARTNKEKIERNDQ